MSFVRPVKVIDECLHAGETCFVQRFENIQRGEKKGAGTTGRIEDGDALDGVPERPEQFRAFAILDRVLRELADVEIERDEIVNVAYLTCDELGA